MAALKAALVITTVAPEGGKGLAPGDVVETIDGRPSREAVEAVEALSSAATPQWLRFRSVQELRTGAAGSAAALAVLEERRTKATLAMDRAKGIIDNLVVKAPIDGIISVKENRDGQFFFFSGMILPQYREGDTTFSGRNIADVVENGRIVQRGSERELLTQDGPFRRLAHALAGGEPELAVAG